MFGTISFYMFKFKIIPRHSFVDGGNYYLVSSEQVVNNWNDETGQINIPFDYVYTATHDPFAGLTANTAEGETFFEANEEGVFYRNEPLVTEERVREIFREEYYNILREDLDNLG